jgi:Fe-S-cluster containining protein
VTDEPTLDAGGFAAWLEEIQAAVRGEADADVPCGECTACCSSSQFVHIAPDEHDTLRHIPKELLFPAPRLPRGHVLMGYDEHGRCPMLVDERCTIYAHRPRTCRTYDCRIFPATGTTPDEESKALITARAVRWRFSHPGDEDRVLHEAVRAASSYLRDRGAEMEAGTVPPTATQRAVVAIRIHDLFTGGATPWVDAVQVAITSRR